MISLKHINTKEIVLHYGDAVNRHLMDGDINLFNRQPNASQNVHDGTQSEGAPLQHLTV
jgi:hypothetical protein